MPNKSARTPNPGGTLTRTCFYTYE